MLEWNFFHSSHFCIGLPSSHQFFFTLGNKISSLACGVQAFF